MGKHKKQKAPQPLVRQSSKNKDDVSRAHRGPVPVPKVPSVGGKYHAAGAFQRDAPSASSLPTPPARWKKRAAAP